MIFQTFMNETDLSNMLKYFLMK